MGFPSWLRVSQMKEHDILDDVPYKCFKKYDDDDEIDVEIYYKEGEINCPSWSSIVFEFELRYDISEGCLPLYATEKFKKEITFNNSSPFALFLCDIHEEEEEEEEESEEEESEDEK